MQDKVLIVDDDVLALRAYKRQLSQRYQVEIATSGPDGLSVLEDNGPFAVIVSDYKMPQMNGIEFLTKCKEIAPNTTRIILTGYATLNGAIDAVNEGNVFLFLTKPLPAKELYDAVLAGVEHHHLLCADKQVLQRRIHDLLDDYHQLLSSHEQLERELAMYKQALEQANGFSEQDQHSNKPFKLRPQNGRILSLVHKLLTKAERAGSLDPGLQQSIEVKLSEVVKLLTN